MYIVGISLNSDNIHYVSGSNILYTERTV